MRSLIPMIREACEITLDAELYGLLVVLENGAAAPGAFVIWRRLSFATTLEWGIAFYEIERSHMHDGLSCGNSFSRCVEQIAQRLGATVRDVEDGLVLSAI